MNLPDGCPRGCVWIVNNGTAILVAVQEITLDVDTGDRIVGGRFGEPIGVMHGRSTEDVTLRGRIIRQWAPGEPVDLSEPPRALPPGLLIIDDPYRAAHQQCPQLPAAFEDDPEEYGP